MSELKEVIEVSKNKKSAKKKKNNSKAQKKNGY